MSKMPWRAQIPVEVLWKQTHPCAVIAAAKQQEQKTQHNSILI